MKKLLVIFALCMFSFAGMGDVLQWQVLSSYSEQYSYANGIENVDDEVDCEYMDDMKHALLFFPIDYLIYNSNNFHDGFCLVPEPNSGLMFFIGMSILMLKRKRK